MPWTPNLSVGVELIDEQHKEWFVKAERLFEAGKNKQSKEYIGELLTFLEDYTKKHFADEEAYMRKINYPEYEQQRQAHQSFIKQQEKLRADYEASGGSLLVILSANQMIIDWLTKHISVMDRKIGQYANGK